ncbi:histidine phosphatase family protein [Aeromonas hydrophila]|uniref:histidine phosphatase family protein n=1 Tax=Aeromonas hydrophila TaxID=644 RepID=UPI00398798DE
MQLVVMRHGQTPANAEERYQGAQDIGLSDTGVAQISAQARALAMAQAPFQRLLSSPLLRARQSAALVADELGLPVTLVPAFRERHVGVFEGLTQQEARERYPALWARNITRRWTEAPPGGESLDAVIARVGQELAQSGRQERVLLVAHGVVAKVIRALTVAGFDDFFEWQLANGAVLEVSLACGDAGGPLGFFARPGSEHGVAALN